MGPPRPLPGTALWLLGHDLRLGWRDLRASSGRLGSPVMMGVLAVAILGVHALVWPLAEEVASWPADGPAGGMTARSAAAFVLLLMTAQTLNGAIKLIHARGDLDLLLASPVPPRRVLTARAAAIAVGAFASAAIFVLPLADAAALRGHVRLLALYPTLAGGALLAAAAGLALALGLFRLIGPRKARAAAQVLAALIGAAFTLGLQLRRFLPDAVPVHATAKMSWLVAALSLPVRAALGDGAALLMWLGGTVTAFAAAALLLGPAFARRASEANGAPQQGAPAARRRDAPDRLRGFGAGPLAQLRRKERRLILRDPWLISQVLLQILYMLPMGVVLWTSSADPGLALSPTLVVVCFQVSSSLTWLGLSGEDAPDLLATAPLTPGALRRGKLQAVGLLTLAVVGPPFACLAWVSPTDAAATAVLCGAGLAVAVLLQLWHVKPARRSAFAARYRESRLVTMVEMSLSMLFGLAAALVVERSPWALAPLALLCGVGAWLLSRARLAGVGGRPA